MTRILFVDDEQDVLAALRSGLRRERDRWTMVFVTSAAQAIEELAREPFDALVSDLRMPGMDGADLLAHVKDSHPQVARIVLSGNAESETTKRARALAHEFLNKPCPVVQVKACLEHLLGASPPHLPAGAGAATGP
jgi:DNA-binding NtrC family response regulator